jgi:small-conductance mechanosensitive channel
MRQFVRTVLLALGALFLALPSATVSQQSSDPVFERDALNAGLGAVPDRLDRDTPRTALESFLGAAEAERWDAAAHVLDLTEIDRDRQSHLGPLLARQLHSVLERKVLVNWADVSDRPDGMDERGSSDDPLAGEKRRSISLGVVEKGDRPVTVRLNRVAAGDDPVWVFSQQTVADIPALYDQYGPSRLEQAIPEPLMRDSVAGLRLWETLFLPVAMVLITVAGLAAWRAIGALSGRARGRLVRRVLRDARLPATIAVTALLLSWLTTELLIVSSLASAIIEPTILLGYVAAAVILLINVIDALMERVVDPDPGEMSQPDKADERALATGMSGLRRAILVIAVLAGGGIILTSASVFRSLGLSLLASAGVLTLVLGFAAREVLGNIMACLQISMNRSARIGDQVIFEGKWCTVERIHFTFVQLKIWTGNRLIVPVSQFVSEPFENWSLGDVAMIRPVVLKLGHTADITPLRRAFDEIVAEEDGIAPKEDARHYVTGHDAFGIDVRFNVPVPDPQQGWTIECRVREKLLARARELGVDLPDEVARMDAA